MNESSTNTNKEIAAAFLRLGLHSFGGPIAHIGYFREEFVVRRKWLAEEQFAQLLAIAQFLPGPASSQLGFSIGLLRGGLWGGCLAFFGFTAPSLLLMCAFALLLPRLQGPFAEACIHGFKLVAVVVVAHAVLRMQKSLAPDAPRAVVAIIAAALNVFFAVPLMQIVTIAGGAAVGALVSLRSAALPNAGFGLGYAARTALMLLVLYGLLLLCSFAWSGVQSGATALALFSAFYRAGALVFGGGHVVLPLLEDWVVAPGWISQDTFLAGYGAAQVLPGPLFSISAFLGLSASHSLGATVVSVAGIFLPGFLLIAALLPLWHRVAVHPRAAAAVAGVNASVLGLLLAALYDPVIASALHGVSDALIAVSALLLLGVFRFSTLLIVAYCVFGAILQSYL